jgi:hypothetical protein
MPFLLAAQQRADDSFTPQLDNPAYQKGTGPVIMIDEGHNNFHTLEGRYKAFAELLELDGYIMKKHKGEFSKESLEEAEILVIANALHKSNARKWYKPVHSAFSEEEINVVNKWVKQGGSLFLIADHMPMPGAAEDLAASFGCDFYNGFALDTTRRGPDTFHRCKGSLTDHAITRGRNTSETVDSVVSFTGQAFPPPEKASAIMIFPDNYLMLMPDTAWVFDSSTPALDIEGWSQGAVMEYGSGRLAVFGEAAMFTAQVAGNAQVRFGINSEMAPQNHQFLLNIIHWLDRIITDN